MTKKKKKRGRFQKKSWFGIVVGSEKGKKKSAQTVVSLCIFI